MPTMVCISGSVRHNMRKVWAVLKLYFIGICPRTLMTPKLHAGASITKKPCRKSNAKNTDNLILRKPFLSVSKAQEFLRQMSNTTESDCDCLPDCELMDLQYSVTTTNLM